MTKEEQILFILLRAGLGDTDCNLMGYALSDEVWQKVYTLAEEQGLLGVVFSAIEYLPKSQLPGMDLLMDWLGQVEYIQSCNDEYRKDTKEYIAKLKDKGIDVAVLKGVECAKYYPQPNRRSLGDLDIFPTKGTYDDVNAVSAEMGLSVDFHDYKHSKIQYKALAIENHKFCTEIRGERVKKDFEKELQRLLKQSLKLKDENLKVSSPENKSYDQKTNSVSSKLSSLSSPMAQFNALFLIAHAFNHFIDEGLSLRQICDWAMFVKAEQDKVVWEDFYRWMERMHMKRFADVLNAITVADLGVVVSNKKIGTTSPYKDKILYEVLYGHKHLHNGGLYGWHYRLAQLRIAYQDSWKYSDIMQSHWLKEYLKGVWYYFTEKEPKI